MKYLGRIDDPKDLVTKEYVDKGDVFIAIYGETTYSQVDDARTAGKVILAASPTYDSVHVFNADIAGEEFSFTMPTDSNYISIWSLDDNNTWTSSQINFGTTDSFYTTSSTAAATASKTTATISGYKLREGNIISVKFTNANTANAPTLKVGSTPSKAIWYKGAVTSASNKLFWLEGEIVTFIYTGTHYEAISINTLAADVDLFPVTYNSDTFQEIHDAYNKGKYIYCINGDRYFALQSITSTQAKFVCVDMASNYQIITYTVSSSGWSVTNQYPVLSINGYSPTINSYGAVSVPVGYANSTNSTSKLFLVGATTQATEPNTYSNSNVYATNGVLNATSFSVNASANIVYNSSAKSIDFTFN